MCKYILIPVLFILSTAYTLADSPTLNVRDSITHEISMDDTNFSVTELVISQGDTVIFKNIGQEEHWPASNLHPTHEVYSDFDSLSGIKPGDSWSMIFTKPGTWRFHDHLVPSIVGSVEVTSVSNFNSAATTSVFSIRAMYNTTLLQLRSVLYSWYYKLLPEKGEEKLQSLLIFDLIKNEQELDLWLLVFGPNKLMDKLFDESGSGRIKNCHLETHKIGLRSYSLFGAGAFNAGSTQCGGGYLHGVFASFLAGHGTENIISKLEPFCTGLATPYAQRICLHGVGHALTAYEDFDLPKVIALCRTMSPDNQERCISGVVMENVETGKGNGIFSTHQTSWLSDDPHFPCNDSLFKNDPQLLNACYNMQVSWMSILFKYDITKVATECLHAVPGGTLACFEGMGREASGMSSYNPLKIIQICAQVTNPDNYNQCIKGALYPVLNFLNTKLHDEGSRFCDLVRETSQDYCYQFMRKALNYYFTESADIQHICTTFAPKYQYLCDDL